MPKRRAEPREADRKRRKKMAILCWAKTRGFRLSGVSVEQSKEPGGGMGIFADKSFEVGDELMTIPHAEMLTYMDVIDDEGTRKILETFPNVIPRDLLCVYLMRARANPQNRFYVYLNALPTNFTTPLYWNAEDREHLKGTNLTMSLAQREASLKEVFNLLFPKLFTLHPSLFNEKVCTYDSFLWAYTSYYSRRFSPALLESRAKTMLTEAQRLGPLIPLFDFTNHKPSTKIEWRNYQHEGILKIISHQPISTGEEVFNNYGNKSSEELLLGYGFVLEDNPHETFGVKVKIEDEHLSEIQKTILTELKYKDIQDLTLEDHLPDPLMSIFRVSLCNPYEHQKLKKGKSVNRLSDSNELECLATLKLLVQHKLEAVKDCVQVKGPFTTPKAQTDFLKWTQRRICEHTIFLCDQKRNKIIGGWSSPKPSVPPKPGAFETWVSENSGISHVRFKKKLIVCSKEMKEGEVLLHIPLSMCPSRSQVVKDIGFASIQEMVDEATLLTLWLAAEYNRDSFFSPFFQTLNKTTHPLCLPNLLKELPEQDELRLRCEEQRAMLLQNLPVLNEILSEAKIDLVLEGETLISSWSVFIARHFCYEDEDYIVPLPRLPNPSLQPTAKIEISDTGYRLIAFRDLPKGSPISQYFSPGASFTGRGGNAEYIFTHGVVRENYGHELLEIPDEDIMISFQTSPKKMKSELIQKLRDLKEAYRKSLKAIGSQYSVLKKYVRTRQKMLQAVLKKIPSESKKSNNKSNKKKPTISKKPNNGSTKDEEKEEVAS